MFQDLADHPEGAVLNADVCIIGGGPAGISMARALAKTKLKVLLLESGGKEVEPAQQELAKATQSGVKYDHLESSRLRAYGGTSGHWAGQSLPLDSIDFRKRDWVPESGWPISYEELTRWLPDAAVACGHGTAPFTFAEWGQKFGIDENPFAELVIAAMRYAVPPVHFGKVYEAELAGADNVTCLLHACVQHLEPTEDGNAVAVAHVSNVEGRKISVRAKRFVLATGAFENSRLLLLCQRETNHPFGNEHDQVGRYTMEHPRVDTGQVVLERRNAVELMTNRKRVVENSRMRFDLRLDDATQEKLGILNHSILLTKGAKPNKMSKGVAAILDGWANEMKPKKRSMSLRIRLEHSPLANSRVTLGDAKDSFGRPQLNINFALGELEARTVAAIEGAIGKHLGRARMGRMRVPVRKSPKGWAKTVGWQDHHMGGTRMHADPTKGVVDANSKVHGLDNLYVAGSSVFPTCGHANPTMNLVALALRLADHLAKEAP